MRQQQAGQFLRRAAGSDHIIHQRHGLTRHIGIAMKGAEQIAAPGVRIQRQLSADSHAAAVNIIEIIAASIASTMIGLQMIC